MNPQLSKLQLEAVKATEGAVLVFAGAGSGKTRVITHRIAHIISSGKAQPSQILAVTFTNKAAKEMNSRIIKLLDKTDQTEGLTVCTFHSLGFRILKAECKKIGYPADFTIYSPYEQNELMKKVMNEQNISTERFSSRTILSAISKMKNNPELAQSVNFLVSNIHHSTAKKLMEPYLRALKNAGAMDFDDLIVLPTILLRENEELLLKYSRKYKYIMVDEYQDTNSTQFELIKLLSSHYKNIFVVGDDDQSIYSWRGAKIENILNFDRDFNGCTTIKMEENYRSVEEIVKAADSLIKFNSTRADKTCFTSIRSGTGEGIRIVEKKDETVEAEYVAAEISKWMSDGERPDNIAVIIRANSQSKPFELAFNRFAIPYSIIGGQKFFENKEIKDIMAYLRILINPHDEISLRRIINYPSRGIGSTTQEKIFDTAASLKIEPLDLIKNFKDYSSLFKKEQTRYIDDFSKLFEKLHSRFQHMDALSFAKDLISEILIEDEIRKSSESEIVARIKLDNVRAFIDAVATDPASKRYKTARPFYSDFINSVTLLDSGDEETKANSVNIITAHSAKGLEFEKVFLIGFYDGGMPNHIAIEENNIEEERRLAYVAMTRAKKLLIITIPKIVSFRGNTKTVINSMFLKEAGLDTEQYTGKPSDNDPAKMMAAILKKLRSED
ncbi:MAG TPA: UvrD-helicase domain-containing protein [bacterium]|nr:UvrD-helicase domain-containing protein [bacterium]HPS29754.1 UvrD-helicase domain-containing protein [bacterium]